jgi:hypothetical protein
MGLGDIQTKTKIRAIQNRQKQIAPKHPEKKKKENKKKNKDRHILRGNGRSVCEAAAH